MICRHVIMTIATLFDYHTYTLLYFSCHNQVLQSYMVCKFGTLATTVVQPFLRKNSVLVLNKIAKLCNKKVWCYFDGHLKRNSN